MQAHARRRKLGTLTVRSRLACLTLILLGAQGIPQRAVLRCSIRLKAVYTYVRVRIENHVGSETNATDTKPWWLIRSSR